MTAGPESMRAIVGAMTGLFYGSILAFVSSFLFGASHHGTSIPLLLSSAPLGVFALIGKLVGEPYLGYGYNAMLLGTPLVWGALGSLVALSGDGKMLRLAQSLALLHYASGLALVATIGPERPELLLRVDGVLWASAYLAGQVVLWLSMRAGSESRRAIVGAMVGVLYGSLSRVSVAISGWRRSRYHHSLMAVVSASWRLRLGRLANWWVGCGRLRDAPRCAAGMGSARGVGCAVRSWDEPQTHSGSGSVAVRIRACTGCNDRRWAYRSGGGSAVFLHCLGAGLPGWAGGAVVANKQAQSTSTERLTTACGRNSRSRHRTDLRSQTTLPKQTQQSRHWAPGEAEAVEFRLLAHRRKDHGSF
jgi:hypothetical protein